MFAETIANPRCEVLDIPRVAGVAHAAGLPLMLDATLTTPALQRPLELGADIVVHSLTKFMGGHGIAVGGVCSSMAVASTGKPRDAFPS